MTTDVSIAVKALNLDGTSEHAECPRRLVQFSKDTQHDFLAFSVFERDPDPAFDFNPNPGRETDQILIRDPVQALMMIQDPEHCFLEEKKLM